MHLGHPIVALAIDLESIRKFYRRRDRSKAALYLAWGVVEGSELFVPVMLFGQLWDQQHREYVIGLATRVAELPDDHPWRSNPHWAIERGKM